MGLRPHSAALLNTGPTLRPAMGLVLRGFGPLTVEVRSGSELVELHTQSLPTLELSDDAVLLARPAAKVWPSGDLEVTPMAYGTPGAAGRFTVASQGEARRPSFAFERLELAPPPAASAPSFDLLPTGMSPPRGPSFSLGLVSGEGPMLELTLFSQGKMLANGWVTAGANATLVAQPPAGGATLEGALLRDLLGQVATYGEVPEGYRVARPSGLRAWWRRVWGR